MCMDGILLFEPEACSPRSEKAGAYGKDYMSVRFSGWNFGFDFWNYEYVPGLVIKPVSQPVFLFRTLVPIIFYTR